MDDTEKSLTDLASAAPDAPDAPVAPDTPKNKREHVRLPVHWKAAIMLNQQLVYGKLSNISLGGVTFLVDAVLQMGSKYPLYIRMPTTDLLSYHQLEASAQVCNIIMVPSINCYRIGLRFLELHGKTGAYLTQYLHQNGGLVSVSSDMPAIPHHVS